jgi:hypothetical protein
VAALSSKESYGLVRRAALGISGLASPAATAGAIALTSGGGARDAIAMATIRWPARPQFRIGAAGLEIGDEQVPRAARVETRFHSGAGTLSRRGFVTACVRQRSR